MQTDDAFPSLSNSWNEQDWHKRISGLCLIRVRNSLCCRNWQILKMNISKQHWRPITASWLSYKCWNVPQCYKACIHLSEASLRQRKQGNITRIFSPWVYTTSKTRTRMSPGIDAWSRTCDLWFLYVPICSAFILLSPLRLLCDVKKHDGYRWDVAWILDSTLYCLFFTTPSMVGIWTRKHAGPLS